MPAQTAADYRAHAEECERLAAAISPENCAMLTNLAHRWWALAAEAGVRTIMTAADITGTQEYRASRRSPFVHFVRFDCAAASHSGRRRRR